MAKHRHNRFPGNNQNPNAADAAEAENPAETDGSGGAENALEGDSDNALQDAAPQEQSDTEAGQNAGNASAADQEDNADEPNGEEDLSDEQADEEEAPVPAAPFNLNGRVEKALQAITGTGGQEKVYALNQLEILTGRLKIAIPPAIDAIDDAEVREVLQHLLSIL